MRFSKLNDWLSWQETLNPEEIELGLERVKQVLSRAKRSTGFNCPLITVAGTNGKGSTVAFLEAIAIAAGLKVCSYTSPHLLQYNERIKINGVAVDDNTLCLSFARIDSARGDVQLTYFEFGTLAAIDIFFQQQPDLVILEVGLGGRLDAVNIMDADVSILSSVAIDHVDWLGDNREEIGFEKAGVFRQGKTVICGDKDPPLSVLTMAEDLHCPFLQYDRDFKVTEVSGSENWSLQSSSGDIEGLLAPGLSGSFQKVNAAMAIMALTQVFPEPIRLSPQLVNQALAAVSLAGRFQKVHARPSVYLDVAHNPQAAKALGSQLSELDGAAKARTWAIVAMLKDKDVVQVLDSIAEEIDCWCFAGLENVTRGMSVSEFTARLADSDLLAGSDGQKPALRDFNKNQCTILSEKAMLANTIDKACDAVLERAGEHDTIIIFGSFITVAEAMSYFSCLNKS